MHFNFKLQTCQSNGLVTYNFNVCYLGTRRTYDRWLQSTDGSWLYDILLLYVAITAAEMVIHEI